MLDLNKLNTKSFKVTEMHNGVLLGQYMLDSIEGLYNLSKSCNGDFLEACKELLDRGYTFMRDEEIEICML